MKSSYSPSARRTPASGVRSTSGLAPYSRTPSSYSGRSTVNKRNPVLVKVAISFSFSLSVLVFLRLFGYLCMQSANDKHLGVEFQSEIRTLAQVEHLNLVKFYGYLEHEDERIVLVEYVTNGTLREHLDCENGIDASMHENVIDPAARVDIAIDVAHAVTYIIVAFNVDLPIIHRNIKSSDILLTANFRAKVADFGFARLAADRDSGATRAIKKFAEGDAIVILDPKPERSAANNLALEKILELALQCLVPCRQSRPSMSKCAEILWSIRSMQSKLKRSAASDFTATDTEDNHASTGTEHSTS
ncbi:hypothetical protein DKX38_002998 [Salix brachista]|uniref:Protein kinase domain-containing protein n=1 Tax=Salix brachista TaxID=2182728 RepID=A0A5N5NNL5_9ROSI|nr:hypothetical protein DKX38_002998 [Salix brachista]